MIVNTFFFSFLQIYFMYLSHNSNIYVITQCANNTTNESYIGENYILIIIAGNNNTNNY